MVNSTPDLQTILASLAQYAPPPAAPFGGAVGTIARSDAVEQDTSTPSVQVRSSISEDLRPRTPVRTSATASPKPIDPATITTWQDGLRCVTKIAAQNVQFALVIRKMIADQKKNELRWYSERQALKHTQANRASSAAQAHSILQSLSGNTETKVDRADENISNKEAELAAFDLKVYAAQLEMENVMTAELKDLGVPFFGTDQSLIVPDEEEAILRTLPESQPRWSPVITKKQLMKLRRRIVDHLEDLYKD